MKGISIVRSFRDLLDWGPKRRMPNRKGRRKYRPSTFDQHSFGAAQSYDLALRNPPIAAFAREYRRTNLKTSVAGLEGVAAGTPLELELELVRNLGNHSIALAGFVVYVWHSDADGAYSIFNRQDANYLRGVGVTDADGKLKFETVFPGSYRGRAPHVHVEVYTDFASMRAGETPLLSERIHFPAELCRFVYASDRAYRKSQKSFDAWCAEAESPLVDPQSIASRMAEISGFADKIRASRKLSL